ncbi:MAG: CpsD/CapB family tyrosine-protein kinase, partial [Nitrospirota bacterium]
GHRGRKDHGPRGWSPADLVLLYSPKSSLAESYRSLRTNLLFTALGKPLQVLQLTSVGIGEGKTSVAVNLAVSMAQAGKRVVVIDADLRRPAIHQVFGIDKSPGLTELLMGSKSFEQVCRSLPDLMMGRFKVNEIMAFTGIDKLNIITSGFMPPNPSECLNSARLDELVVELKRQYDLIIFDAPPTLPVSDSIVIGRKTDGTLLVYQVGDIPRVALRRAKLLLEQANIKVLGIVLNNIRAEIAMDAYQFQYHYPYFAAPGSESAGEAAKLAGAGRG